MRIFVPNQHAKKHFKNILTKIIPLDIQISELRELMQEEPNADWDNFSLEIQNEIETVFNYLVSTGPSTFESAQFMLYSFPNLSNKNNQLELQPEKLTKFIEQYHNEDKIPYDLYSNFIKYYETKKNDDLNTLTTTYLRYYRPRVMTLASLRASDTDNFELYYKKSFLDYNNEKKIPYYFKISLLALTINLTTLCGLALIALGIASLLTTIAPMIALASLLTISAFTLSIATIVAGSLLITPVVAYASYKTLAYFFPRHNSKTNIKIHDNLEEFNIPNSVEEIQPTQ